MVYTETSSAVVRSQYMMIDNVEGLTTFPLDAPDGTYQRPSYTFDSNHQTGLSLLQDAVTWIVDGQPGFSIGLNRNVTVGGAEPTNYGTLTQGEGVVFLHATDNISNRAVAQSLLTVVGATLYYVDITGASRALSVKNGNVTGPTISTATAAVTFDGTSGKTIKNSTLLIDSDRTLGIPESYTYVNDVGTSLTVAGVQAAGVPMLLVSPAMATLTQGSVHTRGYAFTNDSSGLFLAANVLTMTMNGEAGIGVHKNGAATNVLLCASDVVNYGESTQGVGVVYIGESTTVPTTPPASGGYLYVVGPSLMFMNADKTVNLTSGVTSTSTVTTLNGVVRFHGTTGGVIEDSGVTVDVSGRWLAASYGFATDTRLMTPSFAEIHIVTAGTTAAHFTPTATVFYQSTHVGNGSNVAPSYSFTAAPSTGICCDATTLSLVAGGVVGLSSSNVVTSLCGPPATTTGDGAGVLFLNDTLLAPSTNPIGGGFLYAAGNQLYFRDTSGLITILTVHVVGTPGATDNAVTIFSGASGAQIQSSLVTVSDDGALFVANGTATSPAFSFQSATSIGMLWSGVVELTANGSRLTVGETRVTSSVNVLGGNGSASAPTYALGAAGLYYTTNVVHVSVDGEAAMSVGSSGNVHVHGTDVTYTGGKNVVHLENVHTYPTATLASGGLLFVYNNDLIFYSNTGSSTTLSGTQNVHCAGTSTPGALVYCSDTSGQSIAAATAVSTDGTKLSSKLRYSSDALGLTTTGSDLIMTFGNGKRITLTSASMTCTNVPVFADTSIRVGGANGVDGRITSSTFTLNHLNAAGTFSWRQQNIPIFATNATTRNLVVSNSIEIVGPSGNLTIGRRDAAYAVNSVGSLRLLLNNVLSATVQPTKLVIEGYISNTTSSLSKYLASDGSSSSPSYSFAADKTSGLAYDAATQSLCMFKNSDLSACISATSTNACNIAVCTAGVPSYNGGEGVLYVGVVNVAPTSNSTGAYLYVNTTHSLRYVPNVSTTSSMCSLNAKATRAYCTLTTSVPPNTSVNLNNENWIDVQRTGVTRTLGMLSIADTNTTVMVEIRATWDQNSTGVRRLSITTGDTYTVESSSIVTAVTGSTTSHSVRVLKRLTTANLKFAAQIYHTSSSAVDCSLVFTFICMN